MNLGLETILQDRDCEQKIAKEMSEYRHETVKVLQRRRHKMATHLVYDWRTRRQTRCA